MKKTIVLATCFFGLLNTVNAAQLLVPTMPDGLKNGYFSINCGYTNGNYSAEGPVTNWGNYGLLGSIRYLNSLLADKDIANFNVRIQLYCKNNASVNYLFDNTQLKAAEDILINPPQNCA